MIAKIVPFDSVSSKELTKHRTRFFHARIRVKNVFRANSKGGDWDQHACAIGMLGNKTFPTREVVLFFCGHLGISCSQTTATRKLPKWVDCTHQGKETSQNNGSRIVELNFKRKINMSFVTGHFKHVSFV